MASALSPGGGFLGGANAQEESLCMRSTLLPSLKDEFYRLPDLGMVYSPDVLVFRDEAGEMLFKGERYFVDCVSAAMLKAPETEVDGEGRHRYVHAKDRELVLQKMKALMRLFQVKGVTKVVLGAWGCGAYGNPVGEVASLWSKVLLGHRDGKGKGKGKGTKDTWSGIEDIVFAIHNANLADGFAQAFGEGLERDEAAFEQTIDEESETEAQDSRELRDRIKEVEMQLEQAKSEHLKQGLRSVLVGLKSQLKDPFDAGDDIEDENADEDENEGEEAK